MQASYLNHAVKIPLVARFNLALIYLALLLYNCHKYIFKYNSVVTSPTYQDTPLQWKLGKYFLVTGLIFFLYASVRFGTRTKISAYIFPVIVLLVFGVNVLSLLFYDEVSFDEIEYGFYLFTLFPFFFIDQNVVDYILQKLDGIFVFTSYFFIVTNAFVVVNFYINGRLPALAYEGGSVRFGGLWDDPNGFGLLCVFLMFYMYLTKRRILALLLFASATTTLSITAVVLTAFSIVYCSNLF